MIYPYECNTCSSTTEVFCPVSMHTHSILCENKHRMRQVYSLSRPIVDKMEAEYYPSLGTVVRSKSHRRELIKSKGLVEVGNERPATIEKEMNSRLKSRLQKYEV